MACKWQLMQPGAHRSNQTSLLCCPSKSRSQPVASPFHWQLLCLTSQYSSQLSAGQGTSVMIVESPTKATKIQKFLGNGYQVIASYGHVRDLPNKTGAVLPDQNFQMTWQMQPRALPKYKAIADAVRGSDKIIFATDPDREGEAISWHIAQELQKSGLLNGRHVERVTFTDITQTAVMKALQQPRQVSQGLVDAYMARRALDYLVGFNISPLLWRKLPGARSAGRVQSVALRLVCEREQEIRGFQGQKYWSLEAVVKLPDGTSATAKLSEVDGKTLRKMDIKSEEQAQALAHRLQQASLKVHNVSQKPVGRSPPAPFTTSSLQQEAAKKLGFSVAHTMRIAQQLYEGSSHQSMGAQGRWKHIFAMLKLVTLYPKRLSGEGLISYMRTDSIQLSPEAQQEARQTAQTLFGNNSVPPTPRVYKSRAKNTQEAHEAIRPTHPEKHPSSLPAGLNEDQRKLYSLIWSRTIASQMSDATIQQVSVVLSSSDGSLKLRTAASQVQSPGFLQAYDDLPGSSEAEAGSDSEEDASGTGQTSTAAQHKPSAKSLLALKAGQPITATLVSPLQHETRPAGRYNEASLVKAMEEAGIGRPSTYASTISLLQERKYIVKEGRALVPTPVGMDLTTFLARFFTLYVDYAFTSNMEAQLDQVAEGGTAWRDLLASFWKDFSQTCDSLKDVSITQVYDLLDQELEGFMFNNPEERTCPACGTGRLQRKPSKFGSFIGCSNYDNPDVKCGYARLLYDNGTEAAEAEEDGSLAAVAADGMTRVLGRHPTTGQEVSVRKGPFGAYVQMEPLATAAEKGGKKAKKAAPRRASLSKTMSMSSVTLEDALQMLELPKELGLHPDDNKPVVANTGRFGPYVQHGDVYAALPKDISPQRVTFEQALDLIQKKVAKGPGRRGRNKKVQDNDETMAAASAPSQPAKTKAKAAKSPAKQSSPKPEEGSSKTRAPSAYNLFMKAMRPQVKAENPEASSAELMKLVAARWSCLSQPEKDAFKAEPGV